MAQHCLAQGRQTHGVTLAVGWVFRSAGTTASRSVAVGNSDGRQAERVLATEFGAPLVSQLPFEPLQAALKDLDAEFAQLEDPAPQPVVDALDPGGRYVLEHSGIGPTDLVVDCIGLLVAALAIAFARSLDYVGAHPSVAVVFSRTLAGLAVSVPIFAAALVSTRRRSLLHPVFADQLHALAQPMAAGGLAVLAVERAISAASGVSLMNFDWVLSMCVLGTMSVAGARVIEHRRRIGDPSRLHKVVVVGSGVIADRVADEMAESPGVTVVGFVDDEPVDSSRCLGPLSALPEICIREKISHVVVAFSRSQPQEIIEALRPLQGRLPITVVPRLFEMMPSHARMHELGSGLAGLSVPPSGLGPWQRATKRTLDVVGAAAGLIVTLPVLLLIALAIRLTSRGPILFRQARMGCKNNTFLMLKFRTMYVEPPVSEAVAEADEDSMTVVGPFPKLKNDPRVTALGRFLRKTSLDELPQFWNVLRGEMSLVGPRPFQLEDAAEIDGWALRRYSVRPGITGLWQVSGRNDIDFADMCRLDQLYVNCWSMALDIRILLRTIWVVLGGEGAY